MVKGLRGKNRQGSQLLEERRNGLAENSGPRSGNTRNHKVKLVPTLSVTG